MYRGMEVWPHAFWKRGARWRWMISFTFRPFYCRYPLDRLDGPQRRSGHSGVKTRKTLPLSGIEPRSSSPFTNCAIINLQLLLFSPHWLYAGSATRLKHQINATFADVDVLLSVAVRPGRTHDVTLHKHVWGRGEAVRGEELHLCQLLDIFTKTNNTGSRTERRFITAGHGSQLVSSISPRSSLMLSSHILPSLSSGRFPRRIYTRTQYVYPVCHVFLQFSPSHALYFTVLTAQIHRVQNGSVDHPASYPMGTRGSCPGGKAAEAWS
jgi:hypothetical protein